MTKFRILFLFLFIGFSSFGQIDSTAVPFAVLGKGKVKGNKILLKWMVNDPVLWRKSLTSGYKLQRTTITRDGNAIMKDETVVLSEKILPLSLKEWEPIAQKDTLSLVIAQAIYGEEFDVNPPKGVAAMMMVTEKNQQRYAFALMAAEQSYNATKAAGWGFEDETAKPNEKYVYSISLLGLKEPIPSATIYIGLNDKEDTTTPQNLDAIFGNETVMLIWEYKAQKNLFSSYNLERSEDGIHFKKLNKTPIFAWDSKSTVVTYSDKLIENDKNFSYRIRGIDAFGEQSEPSKIISGKGTDILEFSPQIVAKSAISDDEVNLEWEFPEEGEDKITEFQILKADSEAGNFDVVLSKIQPKTRKQIVKTVLKPSNYFLIKALSKNGSFRSSFPALVQPIDSIAPMPPIGLKGIIDTTGVVKLHWDKNKEIDIYGYKIFRGNTAKEEFGQLTKMVLQDNDFKDKVDLKMLSHKVYYKIIALDQRYNESKFSQILEISKPDKIAPSTPVISDYDIQENLIKIKFIQSSSDDVKKHILYRRTDDEKQWTSIYEFEDKKISEFNDKNIPDDKTCYYTIVAIDESGNESKPAEPLIAKSLPKMSKPAINNFGHFVDRSNKNIELFWSSKEKKIVEYQLYKRKKEGNYSLYRIFEFKEKMRFVDEVLSPGNIYKYAVKAIFEDGTASKIEEITVEY